MNGFLLLPHEISSEPYWDAHRQLAIIFSEDTLLLFPISRTSVSLECHVLTENVNKHPWRIILRNKLSQTDIHFKSKISAEEALGEGIMAIHRLVWSTCHLHPPVSNPRLVNPIQKHANH